MYIFKEWVDRSAPGEFDIQIHHSGTLVRQGTEIVAMQRNTIEMTIISWWDVADRIPEYNLLTVGYLFKDWNPVKAVMDGDIGKEYKARIAKDLGIQILDYYYAGPRIVNLREVRNVKTPADLAGVKLRMPGSNCGGQLKIIAAMLTRTGRSTFRPSSPIEHPLEQPGPADARWPGVCAAWLLGRRPPMRRPHGPAPRAPPVPTAWHWAPAPHGSGSGAAWAAARVPERRPSFARAARRCMNSSGDITMWVVPSRQAVLSLSTTCPALLICTRSLASAGRVT